MGQDYGKRCLNKRQGYFHEQLELYRWRADTRINSAISRVFFTSKNLLMNKKKLENFVHSQLQSNNYVDIGQISFLENQNWKRQGQQVMTFQTYSVNLAFLQQLLSLEQTLYVMQILLNGHETIFKRFGKTYVDIDCCFLTQKDELRVWINTNPTINQFFDNVTCQMSQVNTINHIIRLCETLINDGHSFWHFQKQLNTFLQKDLLHHVSFSSVRKFINGYVYAHRISIPLNLANAVEKVQEKSSNHISRQSSQFSLHSHVPQSKCSRISEQSEGQHLNSTGSYLMQPIELTPSSSKISLHSSNVSNGNRRKFEFYRPEQQPVKKISTWDLNSSCKSNKKSLNRSDAALNRSSNNMSISSSFSKKGRPQFYEVHNIMTPKHEFPTRSKLESTTGESFLQHSKNISQMTISKIMHSNSTMNIFENRTNNTKNRQKRQKNSFYEGSNKVVRIRAGTDQNSHSRQPSFDENSSSLFISPASQLVNYDGKGTKKHVNLANIEAVSEFDISEEEQESGFDPALSTKGNFQPSMHLGRQVSGLVSNHELKVFESRGSFISVENSSASDYKGVLIGLGRSAKMVSIPTSKKIQRTSRGGLYY